MSSVLAALISTLVLVGCSRNTALAPADATVPAAAFRLVLPIERDTVLDAREPLVLRFSMPVAASLLARDAVLVRRHGPNAEDVDVVLRNTESKFELAVHPRESWEPNTEYEARISPLLFDQTRTILDRTSALRFRVRDGRGPELMSTAVTRRGIDVTFDRAIRVSAATAIVLRENGVVVPASLEADDRVLHIEATHGLVSEAVIQFQISGLSDRDGDLAPVLTWSGRADADRDAPAVVSVTPRGADVAHHGLIVVRFDESIDPDSLRLASKQNVEVRFDATHSELTIRAKRHWRTKTCAITLEEIEDRSGNRAPAFHIRKSVIDALAGRIVRTLPVDRGQLPAGSPLVIRTSRVIDEESLSGLVLTVEDRSGVREHEIEASVADDGRTIFAVAEPALTVGTRCRLEIKLRSREGRVIPRSGIAFDVTRATPTYVRWLHENPVARGVLPTFRFSKRIVALPHDAVRLTPAAALESRLEAGGQELRVHADFGTVRHYRVELRAGIDGPLFADGSTLTAPVVEDFTIDENAQSKPAIDVIANATRTVVGFGEQILLPREACRITLGERVTPLDVTSIRLRLEGPQTLDHGDLRPSLRWFGSGGAIELDLSEHTRVVSGIHRFHVDARDVLGRPVSSSLSFEIVTRQNARRAFERVQLVQLRFDRDRDGAPGLDFEHDLQSFGLLPRDDSSGLRRAIRRDFVDLLIAYAHALFGRDDLGDPQTPVAARIRLTTDLPTGLEASTLQIGGLDPLGPPRRQLGDASTGYLGRAVYDAQNRDARDGDDAGFGVFPRELLLAQIDYGRFAPTPFTRSFAPFCAHLGGTPFGMRANDGRILRGAVASSPAMRARAIAWHAAKHQLARALARLIAHEVGHLVGLVAPGPLPRGLRGNDGLHDDSAAVGAVMASHATWLQLSDATSSFQPLANSYLRDGILLR